MSRRAIAGAGIGLSQANNLFGQLGTVFGGYGAIGQGYITQASKAGIVNIMPYRSKTWHHDHRLPLNFAVNYFNIHQRMFDPTKPAQLRTLIEPSDHVVYCAGRLCSPSITRWRDLDWGYDAVHRCLPVDIAKMSKEMGKDAFVYISMIGADVDSDSPVLRAKGRAEVEIREVFPEAIIIRPSDVFSIFGHHQTDLFRRLASTLCWQPVPVFPEMMVRRHRPIFNCDIGTAIVYALRDPSCHGKTYELGGRQEMTFEETLKYISRCCRIPMETAQLPFPVTKAFGSILETVFWNTGYPRDHFIRMQYDSVPTKDDPNIYGWADLGIDERDLILMDEVMPTALQNWTNKTPGYGTFHSDALAEGKFVW